MQNGQCGTSCRSRVIFQYWYEFVFNIDTAGFAIKKSRNRSK